MHTAMLTVGRLEWSTCIFLTGSNAIGSETSLKVCSFIKSLMKGRYMTMKDCCGPLNSATSWRISSTL
jgi:hypothetical protein